MVIFIKNFFNNRNGFFIDLTVDYGANAHESFLAHLDDYDVLYLHLYYSHTLYTYYLPPKE